MDKDDLNRENAIGVLIIFATVATIMGGVTLLSLLFGVSLGA